MTWDEVAQTIYEHTGGGWGDDQTGAVNAAEAAATALAVPPHVEGTVRVQKGWLVDLEAEVVALRRVAAAAREAVVLWSAPDWTDDRNTELGRRARALNDALAALTPEEPTK